MTRASAARERIRASLQEHAAVCLLGFSDCPHVLAAMDLIDSLAEDDAETEPTR